LRGEGKVVIANVAERGPLRPPGCGRATSSRARDLGVGSLADFSRKLSSYGPAGTEIPIEIVRDNRSIWLRIKSADRRSFFKKPRLH
jgi:hypothetical protein